MATFQGPFNTGDAFRDQGLNQFASSFWSDPAKQAQAGLYGAEAGKAQVEGRTLNYKLDRTKSLPGTLDEIIRQGSMPPGGGVPPVAAPVAAPPPGSPLVNSVAPLPAGAPPVAPPGAPPVAPVNPNTPIAQVHPGTFQTPGGGVKYAPPAQPNGRPASFDIMPYVTQLSQGLLTPEQQTHMVGAVLNGLVSKGVITAPQAREQLSLMGNNAPWESQQQTQRNATTVGGNITVERMREEGQTGRARMVTQTVFNTATGQNEPVPLSEILANPGKYRQVISKDSFMPTASVPGQPTSPPVNTPVTQGAGTTPYDETGARAGAVPTPIASQRGNPASPPVYTRTDRSYGETPSDRAMVEADAKPVDVVSPDEKTITTTTFGQWRQNPAMGRLATAEDIKYSIVIGEGQRLRSGPRATQGGAAAVPTTVEELNARNAARLSGAVEGGEPSTADVITEGMQRASQTIAPRTSVPVADEKAAKELGAKHFAAVLYPAGSGWSPLSSTAPAVPSDIDQAYHDKLVLKLQQGEYKYNLGAAETEAWNIMRRQGILSDKVEDARKVGLSFTGAFVNVVKSINGQDRLVVHGDYRHIPKDANGDPIVQVPSPSRPSQITRPAPATTPPAQPAPTAPARRPSVTRGPRPPNAIGVAPPNAKDGDPIYLPDNTIGIAQGGYIVPAPAP